MTGIRNKPGGRPAKSHKATGGTEQEKADGG